MQQGPPCAVDAWGLGCLMQEAYSGQALTRTEELRNTAPLPKAILPVRRALSFTLTPVRPFMVFSQRDSHVLCYAQSGVPA